MNKVERREYKDWKGLGIRVRNSREQVGITREKFSEMIDRTENYVLSLEKGDKTCSIHTLHQICSRLKVPSDYILYGDGKSMRKDIQENIDKQVLLSIIDRCSEKELKVLKDVAIAIFPNFDEILKNKEV